MRRAAKVDGNHGDVIEALRAVGASVASTAALGFGFPDAVCGFQGLTFLFEIKLPLPQFTSKQGGKRGEKRPLTPAEIAELDPQCDFTDAEKKFHKEWQGQPIITVRSTAEALAAIGL